MVTTYPPTTTSIEQVSTRGLSYARLNEEEQTLVGLPAFYTQKRKEREREQAKEQEIHEYLSSFSSRKEAKEKEEKRQARLAFLKVASQVRIPWVISPWRVENISQYSLQELVTAALEHCCKRHQGEVAREVYLPFLFPGRRATLIFHQMSVHVRCDRVLPTNVVICVR